MSEDIEAEYKRKLSGLRLDLALGKIDSGTAKSMMQIYQNERDAQLNALEEQREQRAIEETAQTQLETILSEILEIVSNKPENKTLKEKLEWALNEAGKRQLCINDQYEKIHILEESLQLMSKNTDDVDKILEWFIKNKGKTVTIPDVKELEELEKDD